MASVAVTTAPGATTVLPDEAIDGLRHALRGVLLRAQDPGYDAARRINNAVINRRPALIARCTGAADVIAAVRFAREHDLLVSVRGGHNVAGSALAVGGLVIDLSLLNNVRVDPQACTVRVGGGATWGDVDRETQLIGASHSTRCTRGGAGVVNTRRSRRGLWGHAVRRGHDTGPDRDGWSQ
jgi:FAD/FMN-containing dehydrogenase